jgi:hypothetical protein
MKSANILNVTHRHYYWNVKLSQCMSWLTSTTDGSKWSPSCLGHFTPWKSGPNTLWSGGHRHPRAGTDVSDNIQISCFYQESRWDRIGQSIQQLAMGWTVWGSNPGGGEIFRTCPDWPWGPPSLLYDGYLVFPGGKVAGKWRWLPTPI